MDISRWCSRILQISFYLLFILVPLILTPVNYELFEYNKMMVTYGLTAIILTTWIVKMFADRQIRIAKTPLDIPIALFVASQLVSALFSIDPHVSWFGYYSRFNGGMWSVLSYVALFYAFVSNFGEFSNKEDPKSAPKKAIVLAPITLNVRPLLRVALAVTAVVATYGVAERLGVDKNLWVQDVQNRVFSTLGQPNWLAAYLIALIPVGVIFAIQNYKERQWSSGFFVWTAASLLYFFVLLCTRSRSGLIAFGITELALAAVLLYKTKDKTMLKLPLLVLYGTMAAIVFFNGSYIDQIDSYFTLGGIMRHISPTKPITATPPKNTPPLPLIDDGITESGVIRKYVWQAAISAWRASPKNMVIGTGTETFAFAFYQHKPVEHNLTSENDFLYNKAHNEYLNYLATTGIFGLGAYLSFIIVFSLWFIKTYVLAKEETTKSGWLTATTAYALFAGWASLLITNFFGFSVVMVQVLFFVLPAMILAKTVAGVRVIPLKFSAQKTHIGQIAATVVGSALVLVLIIMWYADKVFAESFRLSRSGSYAKAKTLGETAVTLNPTEPLYRDELANTLAYLTIDMIQNGNSTQAAKLAKESLSQSDVALTISPANVNYWKTRTRMYYAFSSFDPQFLPAAIRALETAWKLSPADYKIVYNLAVLYGKQNQNDKAIELLKKSIDLKRNYKDAYFALSIFYVETKQPALAKAILSEYLTNVDPNDKEFTERLRSL